MNQNDRDQNDRDQNDRDQNNRDQNNRDQRDSDQTQNDRTGRERQENYRRYYQNCKESIDSHLASIANQRTPRSLYEPTDYILRGDGKRIRAVLVMIASEAVGGAKGSGIEAGAAVEILHNFTLVHDDIMDNAATRRGRATVHTKWDEGTAILVGDVMIGIAQLELIREKTERCPELLDAFARGIVDVCEGQALDREFERRSDVTSDEYLTMIGMKTGRLIEMAAEIGGHIGNGTTGQIDALRSYARDLGTAFQIQDDLLDLTADPETFGKEIGGDIVEGKRTYLVVRGMERSHSFSPEDRQLLEDLLNGPGLARDQIDAARMMFERNGIIEDAQRGVEQWCNRSLASLDQLPAGEGREMLAWFADMLMKRDR